MRLVLVEWLDSLGCGASWSPIQPDQMIAEPLLCGSVGWLVAESEAAIVIVPHMHGEDPRRNVVMSGIGDLTIPRVAVTRIVDLKEA